jgi:hypothetical protein
MNDPSDPGSETHSTAGHNVIDLVAETHVMVGLIPKPSRWTTGKTRARAGTWSALFSGKPLANILAEVSSCVNCGQTVLHE